jgi:Ca2+-binding EF-hand superfamily protein
MSDKEKKKIKALFDKYDENKNGVLEKSEFVKVFRDLIKSLGEDMTKEEIDNIAEDAISNFDLNQNGIIEFDEFCELISFLKNEKGLSL